MKQQTPKAEGWRFADEWETVAECLPEAPAITQGNRRFTWRAFEMRANSVARALLELGLGRQEKVAHYLYNCPEYLESTFGIFKAGLVPVNTNYRYKASELIYLWENSDSAAVIFHGSLAPQVDEVRARLPRVKHWLWVDDGAGGRPPWALSYEDAAATKSGRVEAAWGRSPDDLVLLYTGGTTGAPKGVMWRQDDVFLFLNAIGARSFGVGGDLGLVRRTLNAEGRGPVHLSPSPLMHANGSWGSWAALSIGGSVVLLPSRSFDPIEMLDTIDFEGVNTVNIVGDAFARPLVEALAAHPGRWSLSSMTRLISTGAALSPASRKGLIEHLPSRVTLSEGLSSSEAASMASSPLRTADGTSPTTFIPSPGTRVLTEDGRNVVPGSGEAGLVAVGRWVPIGYYKDPEASARVFRTIEGERYAISGDYATVDADGVLHFLGRGSSTINTGGEKVYAEEVEEVLREHPAVRDAAVIGIPDERFGQSPCAIVELNPGFTLEPSEAIAQVKSKLASYKAPRQVLFVPALSRTATGKLDYPSLRRLTEQRPNG